MDRYIDYHNKQDFERLLETYIKSEKEVPEHLRYRVLEKIQKCDSSDNISDNAKENTFLNTTLDKIKKYLFYEKQKPILAFASILIIILISVSLTGGLTNLNDNEYADINNEKQVNSKSHTNSDVLPLPVKVYAYEKDDSYDESNVNAYVNGEKVNGNKSKLLMELNNLYNNIKVDNGAVLLEVGGTASIIAYEGTKFKLDVKNIKNKLKDIYIVMREGELIVNTNLNNEYLYEFYIETPSAIINPYDSNCNISVFDNQDTVVKVNEGKVNIFNNIKWSNEITQNEMEIINKYVNTPTLIEEDESVIFVMDDIIDLSRYINENYKRLIKNYISE